MLYISKGTVLPNSTEQLLLINHCGKVFTLTELEAAIWLDGSRDFSMTPYSREVEHLRRMGLIETEDNDSPLSLATGYSPAVPAALWRATPASRCAGRHPRP